MRIFVLGDSFAENLYKNAYESDYYNINAPIHNYVKKLEEYGIDKAMWFTDWLEEWGYEIINLGKGGSCNEDIYYQFSKIDNFQEGDRLIIWWTGISRFLWFNERGQGWVKGHSIHEDSEPYLIDQALYRAKSMDMEDGYANQKIITFIKYITKVHSKYKPIITSFCPILQQKISDSPYFFSLNLNSPYLSLGFNWFEAIKIETNGLIDDGHNGRTLNYLWATGFDEIIKSNLDGGYTKNFKLQRDIKNRIISSKISFKKPPEWE